MDAIALWDLLIAYTQRRRVATTLTITYQPKADGSAAWGYTLNIGNILRDGDYSGALVGSPESLLRALRNGLEYQHHTLDIRAARGDVGQDDSQDDEPDAYAQIALLED